MDTLDLIALVILVTIAVGALAFALVSLYLGAAAIIGSWAVLVVAGVLVVMWAFHRLFMPR